MEISSHSVEANILCREPLRIDHDDLVEKLSAVLSGCNLRLCKVDLAYGIFLLLTCENVQVLLAFCDDPLPVDHFRDASRPGVTQASEATILRRLRRQVASVTALVLDTANATQPIDPDHQIGKTRLCREISTCLLGFCAADLVFWADTDTLYVPGEFRQAHADQAAPETQVAPEVLGVLAESAIVGHLQRGDPDTDLSGRNHPPFAQARSKVGRSLSGTTAMSPIGAAKTANLPVPIAIPTQGRQPVWTAHRAINGLAMTCASTTIGLGTLPLLLGF